MIRTRVIAGVALVAVALINLAAYGRDAQLDLSASRRFSLSPETKTLARAVHAPLHITAFLTVTGGAARDARFLLARYHELNRRITARIVDPDANPGEARRFGIGRYATVVVTYEGRRVDAPDAEELEVSTAILRVLRGGTKTVCVLGGHGEDDASDTGPGGVSLLAQALAHNAYVARPLDLTTGGTVPTDCAVVAVWGPRDPLLASETTTLTAWAKAGGKLMVLASPVSNTDPNRLLAPWGIHFVGGLVIDHARSVGLDLSNVIVQSTPSASPVDDGLSSLHFPATGGLVVDSNPAQGLDVEHLALTSPQSYVASHPDATLDFGPGDIPGPVVVAAAADASGVVPGPDPRVPGSTSHIVRTRVFATGGDAWATNAFFDDLSNRRLLVNALSWLTEQEQLIAAVSRPNQDRPLALTAERQTEILIVTVGAVPAGIIAVGATPALLRRRRRRR